MYFKIYVLIRLTDGDVAGSPQLRVVLLLRHQPGKGRHYHSSNRTGKHNKIYLKIATTIIVGNFTRQTSRPADNRTLPKIMANHRK